MPIRNIKFTPHAEGYTPRPHLMVRITNPDNSLNFKDYGLIDTGAYDCAVPAKLAEVLGHNLKKGKKKDAWGCSGPVEAYIHTTEMEILHPITEKLLLKIPSIRIGYVVGLDDILLGVNNFLGKHILNIDYPNKRFSIKSPIPIESTP